MADDLLIKTLVVILASVCAISLVARLRFPAAGGYLLAGLVIGPHGLQLIAASDEARFLAELGIIFLMFMVGLEFSLSAMITARRDVFGAGSLQVGFTVFVVTGIAALSGMSLSGAVLLGGAVAMSSTAITLKQLVDQGEVSSQQGRLVLGILLFQDLAVLPFLVVLGGWQPVGGSEPLGALRQLATATIALGAAAFVCKPVFRTWLTWVARTHSADLFLLTILLLALGTAFVGHVAGLSGPIGAFLAGMVVGESDFRHQVEDDIRPFRDILLGLFFVTVGMEVDPSTVVVAPMSVLAWIAVCVPGKAFVMIQVGAIMRWPAPVAVRAALILAHGGEAGLLLLTQAMRVNALEANVGQPALLALAASMALGPMLIQESSRFAELVRGASHRLKARAEEAAIREESRDLSDHVILCGCGRVGRPVALVLDAAKAPYIAIEFDLTRFRRAKTSGHKVVFGDAGRKRVIEAAGVARARLVVVTFDRRHLIERILHYVRQQNPAAASVVSAADDQEISSLALAGASTVFPENIAAGLALADQVLLVCGFSQDNAANIITAVRAELHPELRGHVGR
ncbi:MULTISPECIES: cation:proton antiporter domain-containing protein [Bradyrhizobium]|uniref:cation:proton antiporter domain-containing protein n=1 Tax=Bradyrhizobium TaxID=374 RepID=UPI0004152008|nr:MULTISPECIES: cation:proton antiporter [Bradyrhizobium]UFW46332.1 cation:proton antiporter [Bradyrhizobium arachidis]